MQERQFPAHQAKHLTQSADLAIYLIFTDSGADGTSPSHKPVTPSSSSDASSGAISERDRSFKMSHVRKTYHFQSATRDEAHRWVQFLQMAARADLPSPSQVTSA